ncbi:MAG: hypothetical protein PSV35_01285 [bacterium]|nr:hypothetical protein [bacterium]
MNKKYYRFVLAPRWDVNKTKGTAFIECAVLLALMALLCFLVILASSAPESMLAKKSDIFDRKLNTSKSLEHAGSKS